MGRVVFRQGVGLDRAPFDLNFGVAFHLFQQALVSLFTIGTFIIEKNLHYSHDNSITTQAEEIVKLEAEQFIIHNS
jgi:hypothetical protein